VKLLRGFALSEGHAFLEKVAEIAARAPFRHLVTPGGHRMSVAMTNCGALGWVSDRTGYRYEANDPGSGRRWPRMPGNFLRLAGEAAAQAGFGGFVPDACLINRYASGARLSLHQDEGDPAAPIVSVSFGVAAVFLLGGLKRSDKTERILLEHGDVVVLGGEARMRFHGVLALKRQFHPLTGKQRINLTFRKAG
jgi:alkylated DNA repair protein (DNA oxidative demethylase)